MRGIGKPHLEPHPIPVAHAEQRLTNSGGRGLVVAGAASHGPDDLDVRLCQLGPLGDQRSPSSNTMTCRVTTIVPVVVRNPSAT